MFCSKCGAENPDGSQACRACGEALGGAKAPVPAGGDGMKPYNYLVQAILVTIFCCPPFGIVSIVYAAQVDGKWVSGDHAGSRNASRQAKMWSWIGFGIGLGLQLIGLLLWSVVLAAAAGAASGGHPPNF